ncbi:MAG: BMC domain-containing protein [Akkermansiaceae bacterium]|jgi:ethanolamine utilization protein EutM|nr:BMC domain-containing protein [Akkermansiaceae bacterium]
MAKEALGLIETRGLCCLVTGIDAALKSANVRLAGPMKNVGSALCNAVIVGDVAAVKAGIDAAADAASQLGAVVSAHVIARPDDATDTIVAGPKKAAAPAKK